MRKKNAQKVLKKEQFSELKMKTNEKLKQSFEGINHRLRNNEGKKKFSEVFITFIKPLIDRENDDEAQINKKLSWGVFVWNMVVASDFPEDSFCESLNIFVPLFISTTKDKDLLNKYILRKKTEFSNEDFFIIRYEMLFDIHKNMSISVAVSQIDKQKLSKFGSNKNPPL